ncbi:hypothetical protein [Streptomyces wuyuanensis]|uniref:hypothetical protein n=1 Tax=Streptomyces wuyuanensis TaxID=1196353 RepID=UPI003428D57D
MDDAIWKEEGHISPFGVLDWDTLVEGDTWVAQRGVDFHCEPEMFVERHFTEAEYEGLERDVKARIIGDLVCFQIINPFGSEDEETADFFEEMDRRERARREKARRAS